MIQTQRVLIMQEPVEVKGARDYVGRYERELRAKYGEEYIAVVSEVGVIDYGNDRDELRKKILKRTHLSTRVTLGTIDDILNPNFIVEQVELHSNGGSKR